MSPKVGTTWGRARGGGVRDGLGRRVWLFLYPQQLTVFSAKKKNTWAKTNTKETSFHTGNERKNGTLREGGGKGLKTAKCFRGQGGIMVQLQHGAE